jgi:O-antigen/teichoic acid export membrane protein
MTEVHKMTTVQNVTKNSVYLMIANISNKLILFVLFILMIRYLGDVFYGKYIIAVTFVGLFAVLIDLGMGSLIIREVTKNKESLSKYFFNVLAIKVALSLITYALIVAAINLAGYPQDTRLAVYILGVYIVFSTAMVSFINPIFRAFEHMEYEAFTSITQNVLTVVLGALVIYYNMGFIALMAAFMIGSLAGFVLGTFIIFIHYKVKVTCFDLDFCMRFIKSLSPFALGAIMIPIYVNIDRVLLSLMRGDAAVGVYGSVRTLVSVLLMLSSTFNGATFPVMMRSYTTNIAKFKVLYEKSFKYLFMASLPIAVGTTILADKIVLIALGDKFTGATVILQVVVWILIFSFLNNMTGNIFTAMNKQIIGSLIAGALVIVNVSLNLLLIPTLGGTGTAIAAVATEAVGVGFSYYYISRHMYRIPLAGVIVKPCIASAVMGACVFAMNMAGVNFILNICAGAVIYVLMILLIRGLASDDIELIVQMIGKDSLKKMPLIAALSRH